LTNRVSAQQIYELMHNDKASVPQLTEQQRDAVERASVTSPELVVAGAGSGKTELMAVRVLWLVANEHARPDQILGLTFTRKAASELSRRIWDNLQKLRASSLWPEALGDEVAQPTVTTYNSYSNSLFRENALGLGYEAESSLITDAAAYQLARELIVKYGGEIDARLVDLDNHIEKIVEYVLSLAAEMNDNLTHAGEIDAISDQLLEALSNLPKRGGNDFTPGAEYAKELTRLGSKKIIAALADAYRVEKQRLG
jgi:DNA helicase-2/ATP-dependent DNA helicase PcrA